MTTFIRVLFLLLIVSSVNAQRARDFGIEIGIFNPGKYNAITDVAGVSVGHITLIEGDSIRTGVTTILPHQGNLFQQKCPAGIHLGNGFGKLAGFSQVEELGNIETPIVLTNTLSVATGINALVSYTMLQEGNEMVQSVNAIVGETNDGFLNDIRGRHVKEEHIMAAIENASSGAVMEGNVGAGTGTVSFGYKGGIGTSSRVLPKPLGGYTIGVLVQTNFGGILEIDGVHIMKNSGNYPFKEIIESSDGSCMIVVMTDAPVSDRNLKRMAKRAIMGLANTGGVMSNGSGDYVIAVSNYDKNLIPYRSSETINSVSYLRNDEMTPLFVATIEATEEAIINSLFAANSMSGKNGNEVKSLPVDDVVEQMKKYNRLKKKKK